MYIYTFSLYKLKSCQTLYDLGYRLNNEEKSPFHRKLVNPLRCKNVG